MHTTASDGALTTAEILKKCEDAKLELISITDHIQLGAYEALKNPAIRSIFSGQILPGCEFTSHYNNTTIEILGFGIDLDIATEYLDKHFPTLQEHAVLEVEYLQTLYMEKGLIFDHTKQYENRLKLKEELLLYPENRARLTDPRSIDQPSVFLRQELGNPNSPYFSPAGRYFPDPRAVCEGIKKMGGISFLAHPGIYHKSVYDHLEELIELSGVDGLEVWYPSHTPEQRAHLHTLCEKHRLLETGGSDYHRPEREVRGNIIGNPLVAKELPLDHILAWTASLKKI